MSNYENSRINKLRLYLFNVLNDLKTDSKYQINADMLSPEIDNYSLDKLPTDNEVEKWINGEELHRDVFSFRSRLSYSQDVINNLKNVGFFEDFESLITNNNRNGILPDIEGINSIECLSQGTMTEAETSMATFDIQIQIVYKIKVGENPKNIISL